MNKTLTPNNLGVISPIGSAYPVLIDANKDNWTLSLTFQHGSDTHYVIESPEHVTFWLKPTNQSEIIGELLTNRLLITMGSTVPIYSLINYDGKLMLGSNNVGQTVTKALYENNKNIRESSDFTKSYVDKKVFADSDLDRRFPNSYTNYAYSQTSSETTSVFSLDNGHIAAGPCDDQEEFLARAMTFSTQFTPSALQGCVAGVGMESCFAHPKVLSSRIEQWEKLTSETLYSIAEEITKELFKVSKHLGVFSQIRMEILIQMIIARKSQLRMALYREFFILENLYALPKISHNIL